MTQNKKRKGRKKNVLTPQQLDQRSQINEVRRLMNNMGFERIKRIGGKKFLYKGRTSEIDDVFYCENVIVILEYTTDKNPGTHLKSKKLIFDKINEDHFEFIEFLAVGDSFPNFKEALDQVIKLKYTVKQLQLRVIYASKNSISQELKGLIKDVNYLDYGIVKYFESISKIIKKTSRYEFLDFLGIEYSKFGDNINQSGLTKSDTFHGHILPEEHSTFKEGYKLVSFYIDASSMLRRAFVLRRDGWRNGANVSLYQRMFVAKKIKSMRKYLHTEKRVYINNIIATLSTDSIKLYDATGVELKIDSSGIIKNSNETRVQPAKILIEDKSSTVGIIDGQHRLYSYHEGDDVYEKTISKLRGIQNLLVTAVLFPKKEHEEKRIKFEAGLFLEINSNQSGAPPQLKQEIEYMRSPFSTTSISKYIINKLNESGPLSGLFEEFFFQKGKLKTTSIISFGLRQVVKYDGSDSLFTVWSVRNKRYLKDGKEDFELLSKYRDYCLVEVRKIFIALKANVLTEQWQVDRSDATAILNVTTINGIINCLRLVIENKDQRTDEFYRSRLKKIVGFQFKKYKSSQYRKMGEDIYNRCFGK